jgi:hypothetical protein
LQDFYRSGCRCRPEPQIGVIGQKGAKEALDDTTAAWEGIADRLGQAEQLEAYRAAIGYKLWGSPAPDGRTQD